MALGNVNNLKNMQVYQKVYIQKFTQRFGLYLIIIAGIFKIKNLQEE